MAANLSGGARPAEGAAGRCADARSLGAPIENVLRHRVQWGETDAAGIVFYPNYYRWFDWASHEWLRAAGYPVPEMLTEGYAVPLVETHARFLAALLHDDEIEIVSRIGEVRTRTFRIEHRVMRGGQTTGEGYEVRVWARVGPGGSLTAEPIPQRLRKILGP